MIDGRLPADALEPVEFKALTLAADGLTHKEVTDTLDLHSVNGVRDYLQAGRNRLGILDSFQLAGYFPLDTDDEAVGSKKLAKLEDIPDVLDILEAISTGKRNKDVAAASGVKGTDVRERLGAVEGIWGEDGLMSVRIANAIRARYIQALETRSGTIEPRNLARFTLPRLARLEPNLINSFASLGTAATT